jgi:hypothetical protein
MLLLRPARFFLAGLFFAPLLVLAADFAHETSDLTVDPAIRWGRLENGLRYALLPNPGEVDGTGPG